MNKKEIKQVFLGGTCNEDKWREEIVVPILEEKGIKFFNPVVEDWTPECIEIENKEKEESDVLLFVLTSKMTGVYSVAEFVHSAITNFSKYTGIIVVTDGFSEGQLKSLNASLKLVEDYCLYTTCERTELGTRIASLIEIILDTKKNENGQLEDLPKEEDKKEADA